MKCDIIINRHDSVGNFVCGFHDMEPLDNEGKRLVSMLWQCEMVKPDLTSNKIQNSTHL